MEIKTRIVAIIVIKGKLLMLKGKGYKELWTPGGKIKPGESDEDCLRRELEEETGTELLSMKFFKKYSAKSFYSEHITKQRVYIVSIKGSKIIPQAEIEDFIWLSRNDFEKGNYPMIPITQNKIIPDLIKAGIF
ncbi:MAG: NUDIX domain-containing protein [Candidatus Berkelbacteria bacterium]|nr:NUDIX domain-containing protein [Candidatus Berkelbacteria bacterium]